MDDLDGIIRNSFVSNSIREARGLLTKSLSKPKQPENFKNRNLFAVENDRTRKREKSCNIDLNMRATAHDWNKVFTSSIGFKSFNKTLSTSSLVSMDNEEDFRNRDNLQDLDDFAINLSLQKNN